MSNKFAGTANTSQLQVCAGYWLATLDNTGQNDPVPVLLNGTGRLVRGLPFSTGKSILLAVTTSAGKYICVLVFRRGSSDDVAVEKASEIFTPHLGGTLDIYSYQYVISMAPILLSIVRTLIVKNFPGF